MLRYLLHNLFLVNIAILQQTEEIIIDPGLAQQAAVLLAPYLPYLMNSTVVSGKDAAIKALGGKFVEAGWNKAADLWKKIWPKAGKKPEIARALQDVAEHADDPGAETVLSWQLNKVIDDMPPEAIAEIQNIIAENVGETRVTKASNGSVAIGGDAYGNIINIGANSHGRLGQQQQIDDTDFRILQAIQDLRVSIPNADKINARLNLNPDELGARMGVMHSKGLIKAESGSYMPGVSLPNGIYAAGLTDHGRMALMKRTKN